MVDHDSLYHRLFSHPEMIRALLTEFVKEPWVEGLRFAAMERVSAKFRGPGHARRDSDVIWRIPMADGPDLYLYVLLEFQSAPERWMALRVLVYVGLLWQQLVQEGRITADGRLPPVFPIVLYNGEARWWAPVNLAELIALPEGPALSPFQPAMRYHLIDEGSYSAATLAAGETPVTALFAFESATTPDAALPAVERLVEWFRRHPGKEELQRAFVDLIAGSLAAGGPGTATTVAAADLKEMRNMLAARVKEWQQQWLRQGLEQGLEQGRQEGRLEGAALVLRHLLERRFGPLPEQVVNRLGAADQRTLEQWSLRLLEARTLAEVFE